MAEPITFRPDDITLGDMEDFEAITGRPFFEVLTSIEEAGAGENPLKKMQIKDLTALVFIVKRSTDPAMTIERARRTKIDELVLDFRPVDPTGAVDSETAPPSATSGG